MIRECRVTGDRHRWLPFNRATDVLTRRESVGFTLGYVQFVVRCGECGARRKARAWSHDRSVEVQAGGAR